MDESNTLARFCVTVSGADGTDGSCPPAGTLVFVHGFGTSQAAWHDVASAFSDRYRIVTYDQAGAGGSAPEAFSQYRHLSLNAYAADLAGVCDALQLRDPIAVGHSVGGMVALLASVARPELFSRLVLICASPRYLDDAGYHGGFTDAALQDLYGRMLGSYPDWAESFASHAMTYPDRPGLARHFADSLKSIPPERALSVLCAILQSDHRADLPKVDCPVLLLQSRDDMAVPPEVAHYMHRNIRGSRLRFIDATGHLPHVSEPGQIIGAMREFLAEPAC